MDIQRYSELLEAIREIRVNWVPDRPGVPKTRPVEPPSGKEILLPLPGRNVRAFFHQPNTGKAKYPVYFNFHGGGMCAGSAEIDEFLCKAVCEQAECAVLNLDYRLAPEHPFPAALDDTYETVLYVTRHAEEFSADADAIALGGQSAGGNLAAASAIRANRSGDFHYRGLVLCYAGLNFAPHLDSRRCAREATGRSALYSQCYSLGDGDMTDPLASPVFARREDLLQTPSALLLPAELDALKVDSEVFAKNLALAGVPVLYKQFQNCAHGFTHRAYEQEPQQAINMISDYLRCSLSSIRR